MSFLDNLLNFLKLPKASVPTTGENAPLRYDTPTNTALQEDRSNYGDTPENKYPALGSVLGASWEAPKQTTTSSPTSSPTNQIDLKTPDNNSGNDGGMSAQINLARGAYENAMRDLQSVFGQAQGVYDQGMGSVGKIRDRATESYNTGRDNILNRFEGERGNLQRESTGNANRLRGTMRALGMGGSAYVRGIGNNDKANARAIGSLRQSRGQNELANTQQQTQSNDFADTQEGTLNRYMQGASRALQSGQEKASLVNQGDVAGINSGFNDLRSNIFANQQALKAAGGAAAGYTVDPFAPNMASMIGSLNGGLPQFSGQQAVQGGNVNLANENLTYLEKLQRGLI